MNARGNVFLEVTRDYFKLSSQTMHKEIQWMRGQVEAVLLQKGIDYQSLKSALVPDRQRHEIAFVFDTLCIESNGYGYEVFKRVIPLLNKNSNHSILCGDYIGSNKQQTMLYEVFVQAMSKVTRIIDYSHSSQFFIVFINNLTPSMIDEIHQGLIRWEPYVGYADATYSSKFKNLLSTMLVNTCLKHKKIIIQGHEDDRSNSEDINTSGYPYEESGYVCKSLEDNLYSILLTYKIERPVYKGFNVDTEFSLNAVTDYPILFDDFKVEVEVAKHKYLVDKKAGSLEKAGLKGISAEDLGVIIKAKIQASYIYNMTYIEEHNVMKFNIIVEIPSDQTPVRLLAALEYIPDRHILRLITLF